MLAYATKIVVTTALVVAISEIAKRSSFWGAALASIPLTSVLAFIWLHVDGEGADKIAALSSGVFWLVIPSLLLFVLLPWLLKSGWPFWPALLGSIVATSAAYALMAWLLARLGIAL